MGKCAAPVFSASEDECVEKFDTLPGGIKSPQDTPLGF